MRTFGKLVIYPLSRRLPREEYDDDLTFYLPDIDLLELSALYSQGIKTYPGGNVFDCAIDISDPNYARIVEFLRLRGFAARTSRVVPCKKNEYPLELHREYDKADWEALEYLQPRPETTMAAMGDRKGKDGCLRIEAIIAKHKGEITSVEGYRVVTDKMRHILEKSGLRGMQFREIYLYTKGSHDAIFAGHWELTSDLKLPLLDQGITKLLTDGGQPYDGDASKKWYPVEGVYMPAELHYKRAALKAFGDFDVALTGELLGGYRQHTLIVSKRFYDLCVREKAKMKWVPVRVDD